MNKNLLKWLKIIGVALVAVAVMVLGIAVGTLGVIALSDYGFSQAVVAITLLVFLCTSISASVVMGIVVCWWSKDDIEEPYILRIVEMIISNFVWYASLGFLFIAAIDFVVILIICSPFFIFTLLGGTPVIMWILAAVWVTFSTTVIFLILAISHRN